VSEGARDEREESIASVAETDRISARSLSRGTGICRNPSFGEADTVCFKALVDIRGFDFE
jgi:hypothetical protein